jgi:hypothetical protein
MTSEMQFLLERLQVAIDEAIAESELINDIVTEMKKNGYDMSLVLESSVAISPIDEKAASAVPEPRLALARKSGEMELTAEDVEFLQELNISLKAA